MRLNADILRVIRRLNGCTQERLAAMAGVTKSYVNKIERGERPLTPQFERRVRRALGLTDERIAEVAELCKRLEVDRQVI